VKTSSGKYAAVSACAVLGFLSACESVDLSILFIAPASVEATRTQTVTLSDGAKVVVNNDNGSTVVKVDSEAAKATIKITRIAFAQDKTTADTLLGNIVVTVTQPGSSDNTLTIDAPCPASATDDLSNFTADFSDDEMDVTKILMAQQVAVVRLVVTLPPGFDVEVTHKNGLVQATGLDAAGQLTVGSGKVEVLESPGDVTVRLTDGQVEVSDHEGSLDAAVTNGAITIGVAGLSSTEQILADATNGQVALTLPQDIDADLIARTKQGTVAFSKSDFDAVSDFTQTLQSVSATLNGGGPTIDVQTQNGLVSVAGQ
jgi:hypothetical protein